MYRVNALGMYAATGIGTWEMITLHVTGAVEKVLRT